VFTIQTASQSCHHLSQDVTQSAHFSNAKSGFNVEIELADKRQADWGADVRSRLRVPGPQGRVVAMKTKRVLYALLLTAVAAVAFYAERQNFWRIDFGSGRSLWDFIGLASVIAAFYQVLALLIAVYVRARQGPEGEARMLTGFTRSLAILAVIAAFLYSVGVLKTIGVVAAGFAGMLVGWSLQAPMSGLVAWALVTVKRPFRVSDRVQFPSLGLTGDVKQVGIMYTILDQVGGTIGSEDPIGRDVLIPNAMLFNQVAINYTARTVSPYFLDEVVIRLTYDSDWDTAEQILLNAARSVTADVIRATGQEPYVRSDIWDYGILMRLRYMTKAKDRPRITHEIVKHIFKNIQANPRVDMAIPFVYSYRKGSAATERRFFPKPEGVTEEVAIEAVRMTERQATAASADENEILALMENIRAHGLLQPIVVKKRPDGGFDLLAGEQRLLACKRLGWKMIPALVHG